MTIKAARDVIRAVADRMKNRIGGADLATVEEWEKELRKAVMLMQSVLASDLPPCKRCGGPTAPRFNRRTGDKFLGCLAFPDCRGPSRSEREKQTRAPIDNELDLYAALIGDIAFGAETSESLVQSAPSQPSRRPTVRPRSKVPAPKPKKLFARDLDFDFELDPEE